MKKIVVFFILVALAGIGCARIQLEAPKEPIKVDVSMRLDIYQHVQKDINAIEDIVSGNKSTEHPRGNESFLSSFIKDAYAQEGLSPEVEQAALRRRDRRNQLIGWEEKQVLGENRSGLVEIRKAESGDSDLRGFVKAENNDRMIIYHALAQKNNTSVEEIQELYANRLQQDAPVGTPIEVLNEAIGEYDWKVK